MHSLTAAFAPVVRRNRVGRYRAAQVAWKLMEYFLEFAEGVADIQLCLAWCDGADAQKMAARLINAFSAHEIYIERWYDQFMASCALKEMATCAVNETER